MNSGSLKSGLRAALLLLSPAISFAATPLATVHPSYVKHDIRPSGFRPKVGGMAFLSDGRLVVGGWGGTRATCCPSGSNYGVRQYTGKVYVLSNATGSSPAVTVDTIATGLEDIMGLTVVRDTIYVSGGNVIVRIINPDNAGPSDRIDTVFILPGTPQTLGSGAGQTTNAALVGDSLKPVKGRSEWMYGLLQRNDTFFVAPSSMYNSETFQVNPYRGRVLAVTPGNGTTNKRGSFRTIALGFRHPTGLTFGPNGTIWTTETQGPWFPTNKLTQVSEGGFYGNRHARSNAPIIADDTGWNSLTETPAAVFLPQEVNSSLSAVFSGSPGAPFYLSSGPYAGQFLMGDLEWGGVQRYFVEVVGGRYQGAGFVWMGGLESGVYRMATGPDGMLYMGMMGETGDWNWNGQFFGLQKVAYNGAPTFEMLAVRSRAQGMEIEFTTPVDTAAAKLASNYTVQTYYYQPTSAYGGTKAAGSLATLAIGAIQVSPDRKRVYLPLTGLVARAGTQQRIVEITLGAGLKSAANANSWNTKAYYTLNAISNTQPFDTTQAVPVNPGADRMRLEAGLKWSVRGGRMDVHSAFQGAYTLRLVDLRGNVLATAAGRGPGVGTLPVQGLRGRFAVLRASGDGVVLNRTLMLP
jgi:glucose/arabinose dehydrogenase